MSNQHPSSGQMPSDDMMILISTLHSYATDLMAIGTYMTWQRGPILIKLKMQDDLLPKWETFKKHPN